MSSVDVKRPIDLITTGRLGVNLCSEQIGSRLEDAMTFRKYLGGTAGSIAIGASRQGLKTAILSGVGCDPMGDFLVESLRSEGVDTQHLLRVSEHLTALAILGINPPEHFPILYYRQDCADLQLQPEHCDKELLKQARAILITGTWLSQESIRATTHHLIELARHAKTRIVFDLDFRPTLWQATVGQTADFSESTRDAIMAQYQAVLPSCDMVVGSPEEFALASGQSNLTQALETIRSLTDAILVVENNHQGCDIITDDVVHAQSYPSFPVNVLNRLGAGDAFVSGLLAAWLQGESWQDCALRANACAATSITRHGMSRAIPCVDEVNAFISRFKTDPDLSVEDKMNAHRMSCHQHEQPDRFILAFDHRTQFEQACDDVGRARNIISAFKQQVFAGFMQVRQAYPDLNLAILVDREYGAEVLSEATMAGVQVGAPIEDAGSFPVRWVGDGPIYEQILQRPANWAVKVHWQYHPESDVQVRLRQLSQLQLLSRVCESLDRRLEVELVLPVGYQKDAKYIVKSMEHVYEQGVYPWRWKLEPLKSISEWQLVCELCHKYDPSVKVILLAGNYKFYEDWREHFKIFRSTRCAAGFAIGRSVFWEPWLQLLASQISLEEVPALVAKNFQVYLDYWVETQQLELVR